ncbi:MAG: helix-turn-helix domain-containing protein [Desulfobacterales bacterium]
MIFPIRFTKIMNPLGDGFPESWLGKTLHEVKETVIEQVERTYHDMVLTKTKGRVAQAARPAGIHPRGLYDKMKRLDLKKESYKHR